MYAFIANNDHLVSNHFFPQDVLKLTSETIANMYYTPTLREMYHIAYHDSDTYSATDEGEYSIVESMALVFYLKYIFDEIKQMFTIVPRTMRRVSIVINAIMQFHSTSPQSLQMCNTASMTTTTTHASSSSSRHHNRNRHQSSNQISLSSCRNAFGHYLQQLINTAISDRMMTKVEGAEVMDVWHQMTDCEICIIPSVLLFNKHHTANEWLVSRSDEHFDEIVIASEISSDIIPILF